MVVGHVNAKNEGRSLPKEHTMIGLQKVIQITDVQIHEEKLQSPVYPTENGFNSLIRTLN